jgi:hypothetical protein
MRTIDPKRIEVVDPAIAAILRRKTPAQRLAVVFECNRTFRSRLAGHLRTRHPDWDDDAIAREIARRLSRGTT